MMKAFMENRPVLFGGIAFGIASLVLNCLYIIFFNMTHVYDVLHVLPVIILMEPIIDKVGYLSTPLMLLPIAIVLDFVCGLLFGWIAKKLAKTPLAFVVALILLFGFYWVVITYQWIMII